MTTSTDYNGWANYSTWNIPLWIDNDEWNYQMKVLAKRQRSFTPASAKRLARLVLGNSTPDGVKIDAKCIDWKEIADSWNED